MTQRHQMSGDMQQCIDNCISCHRVCVETTLHCLEMGGQHAEAGHIRTMLDCAQICQTSADFMLRGSEFHQQTCRVCAEVCERCAGECERLAADDQHMQRCADMCRRCADSCRAMAAMSVS
jgi:hypothetical protein